MYNLSHANSSMALSFQNPGQLLLRMRKMRYHIIDFALHVGTPLHSSISSAYAENGFSVQHSSHIFRLQIAMMPLLAISVPLVFVQAIYA